MPRQNRAAGLCRRGLITSPTLRARVCVGGCLLFAYAWACFTPFNWDAPLVHWTNGVERTPDNGFKFTTPGLVVLNNVLQPHRNFNKLTVNFKAESHGCDQKGPARIVSSSIGTGSRNFTIGQWSCNLVVRVRREGSDENGLPGFEVTDVFASRSSDNHGVPSESAIRVQVAIQLTKIEIWIDGVRRLSEPLQLGGWNLDFPLLLGNELDMDRPWRGQLEEFSLHIDDLAIAGNSSNWQRSATAWLVPDDLHSRYSLIPFDVVRRPSSYADADTLRAQKLDVPLNIIGFIPLGMMFVWLSLSIGRAILWSLVISLCIELVQLGIVGRYTSITDLILNGVGGGLGALLGTGCLRLLTSRRRNVDA